jgi:UDP-hydrolysing UDP-N-acetyl-D-glucosamine 2-epimerase
MRRIGVVTTSRADYGCLRHLMKEIKEDPELELSVFATGMHLSIQHGCTVEAIARDGFEMAKAVEMVLSSDSESAVIKSIGVGLIGFADALAEIRPDILVLLGDRYELLAPGIAAVIHRIPIAHIHGGETSEGAIDEVVRHSVTKMAVLHFPATEEYRRRIVQMGERSEYVLNCGAPGLDALYDEQPLSKAELQEELGMDLSSPVAIATYHPVTLEVEKTDRQAQSLLEAIERSGIKVIFTRANADPGGSQINRVLEAFVESAPERYLLHTHLGQRRYMSCLRHVDLMIGNSSSGLIEAPSFKLPVVNIGNRQRGRVRAANVIDVGYSAAEIRHGIQLALSKEFRASLEGMRNPYDEYGDGRTSFRIKERLKSVGLSPELLMKPFRDLQIEIS